MYQNLASNQVLKAYPISTERSGKLQVKIRWRLKISLGIKFDSLSAKYQIQKTVI
jgi:hypothetical protein